MYYFLSLVFIPILLLISFRISKKFNFYDYPDNYRKIHNKPILISGGIFFELIFLFYFLFFFILDKSHNLEIFIENDQDHLILLSVISLSFFVGLYDDQKNLNAYIKLVLIYLIFIFSLFFMSDTYKIQKLSSYFNFNLYFDTYSIFFTAFCYVILLNSINMADGINSLSSNIFLIWLFFITIFIPANNFYFILNVALMLGLILFSILNFNNKCFLGDSGCFVLVAYICFLTVYIYNKDLNSQINILNLESIFLLFSIPGIDMLRLFIERIFKKKNPLKADRNHLHHKLIYNFGNLKSLIVYNSLVFFPWLLYLISTSLLPYIIIIVIVTYSLFIVKLNKKYEKN